MKTKVKFDFCSSDFIIDRVMNYALFDTVMSYAPFDRVIYYAPFKPIFSVKLMVSTSFEFAIGLHGCCLALTELLLQLLC
jgi:hypothetical protein